MTGGEVTSEGTSLENCMKRLGSCGGVRISIPARGDGLRATTSELLARGMNHDTYQQWTSPAKMEEYAGTLLSWPFFVAPACRQGKCHSPSLPTPASVTFGRCVSNVHWWSSSWSPIHRVSDPICIRYCTDQRSWFNSREQAHLAWSPYFFSMNLITSSLVFCFVKYNSWISSLCASHSISEIVLAFDIIEYSAGIESFGHGSSHGSLIWNPAIASRFE